MKYLNRKGTFHLLLLLSMLIITNSCVRKVEMHPPNFVQSKRFWYVQDGLGRWFIVTASPKDLDDAIQRIQPGPSTVDKLDLWVNHSTWFEIDETGRWRIVEAFLISPDEAFAKGTRVS